MELITFSNFEKIANIFTVTDIADSTNLYFVESEKIVDDFDAGSKGKGNFPIINFWVNIVTENNIVVGFYTHKSDDSKLEIDEEGSILNIWKDIMEPIPPSYLLSGDTPLIDLLTLFNSRDDFYLVLNKDKITHSVSYYDLDCNEVKISIFALIIELENILNDLIIKLKLVLEEQISEERLLEIKKLSINDNFIKYKSIVYYMNLRDKFKILSKSLDFGFTNKSEFKTFINKLMEVRNKIAHGESIIGYTFWVPSSNVNSKLGFSIDVDIFEEKILFEPRDMKLFIQNLRMSINSAKYKLLI